MWHELGGGFTSVPFVLPASGETFDLFIRGLDFQIYHALWTPNTVPAWVPLGAGLLGAPTAASAPCAVRVPNGTVVFVTASDGAVWTTLFDGRTWKPWTSLGPAYRPKPVPNTVNLNSAPAVTTFTSEPVARALHPIVQAPIIVNTKKRHTITTAAAPVDPPQSAATNFAEVRVDVFAVGSDTSIWHKWLDKDGWHGETETDATGKVRETGNWVRAGDPSEGKAAITTSCVCAPSLVSTGTARGSMAMPTADMKMVQPRSNGQIYLLTYEGTAWRSWEHGPRFRLPSHYTFSIDSVQIDALRSNGHLGQSDTDFVAATLTVGKWPLKTATFPLGDVSTGGQQLFNLVFGPVVVEMCEPAILTYSIVNSGQASAMGSIQSILLKGAEDYVNDQLKSLASPDPTTIAISPDLPEVVLDAGGGPTIFGSLLGAGVGVFGVDFLIGTLLLSPLLSLAFANCDGVVAAEPIGYQKGRDIESLFASTGTQKYNGRTRHLGSDSATGCGRNSDYTVAWSITQSKLGT